MAALYPHFEEVARKAKKISHEQTRRESEEYLEMVMFQNTLKELEQVLEGHFGSALKAAGQEVEEDVERITNNHGGIAREQILYHASRDHMRQLAMVWPWQDGKRMTVKLIQECE